jgi:hypothetical protein
MSWWRQFAGICVILLVSDRSIKIIPIFAPEKQRGAFPALAGEIG